MMAQAFATLLDRVPPVWLRKLEAAALMGVFSEAFGVEAPATEDLTAEEALMAFREFTAACMEAALEDEDLAVFYRARLAASARTLGEHVHAVAPFVSNDAFRIVRYLYRGIGIELDGAVPGSVQFGPCSFAQRYSARDCWFMSAFDEGFMQGALGLDATLEFSCRLTEGASCCCARFD